MSQQSAMSTTTVPASAIQALRALRAKAVMGSKAKPSMSANEVPGFNASSNHCTVRVGQARFLARCAHDTYGGPLRSTSQRQAVNSVVFGPRGQGYEKARLEARLLSLQAEMLRLKDGIDALARQMIQGQQASSSAKAQEDSRGRKRAGTETQSPVRKVARRKAKANPNPGKVSRATNFKKLSAKELRCLRPAIRAALANNCIYEASDCTRYRCEKTKNQYNFPMINRTYNLVFTGVSRPLQNYLKEINSSSDYRNERRTFTRYVRMALASVLGKQLSPEFEFLTRIFDESLDDTFSGS